MCVVVSVVWSEGELAGIGRFDIAAMREASPNLISVDAASS